MSPIRPENRGKYPGDWKEISLRIKERAGWRCECEGECGVAHEAQKGLRSTAAGLKRCAEIHGNRPLFFGGKGVVLTVAHLDHDPANCEGSNLKAMCQRCHNRYDLPTRLANRRKRLAEAAGQEAML